MFEKLEEEIEVKADEYALEESTACDYGESSKHVYQGYFYGFKKGAEFGYNKAKEEIRKELLELRADSFDAGMFLRVGETLRNLGIKEIKENDQKD